MPGYRSVFLTRALSASLSVLCLSLLHTVSPFLFPCCSLSARLPVHLSPTAYLSLPLSPHPAPTPSLPVSPVPGLGPVLDKGQVMTGYYRWLQRAGGFVWLQSVATVAMSGKSPGERHVLWVSYVLR